MQTNTLKPSDYIARGWNQHELALDKTGRLVSPADNRAVSWCALGAIMAVYPLNASAELSYWRRLTNRVGGNIVSWNNDENRTQDEVLAVMKQIEKELLIV